MTFGKIGARDMLTRWRNPYATDWLLAMWHGRWNVGGGVHDPHARVWKDLIGNRDATLTEVGSFGADCLICNGGERSDGLSIAAAYCDSYIPQSEFAQVEVVYRLTSQWGRSSTTQGPQFVFATGGMTKTELGGTFYFTDAITENYKRLIVDGKYLSLANLNVESRFGSRVSVSVAYAAGSDSREATYYALNGVEGTLRRRVARRNQGSVTTFGGVRSLDSSGGFYYGMSGEICCVRVYSRPLTAEQRAANLAADVSEFNLSL